VKCWRCGQDRAPDSRVCYACGAWDDAATPAAVPAVSAPPHLTDKVLSSRGALEGERKQVTVLFADLKNSMELLADRDPEEARVVLDEVLERMMEAVHRYGGTVNQVMGDGIMALFGAPLAHEDHAVRACYAALRMQATVTRYAEEIRGADGPVVRIRVGLNSGDVLVRLIGSDLRMDYTAVGQTTHLAARMEQMATPGAILIAPHTLRLAAASITVHSLGPQPVKGLEGLVELYELVGVVPARSILKSGAGQRWGRFVGRQAELERLAGILAEARQRHGQVVAVTADAGLGKTRLLYEFVQSPQVRDWLVLWSSSLSYETSAAWAPVIELLRQYFELDERATRQETAARISGKILALHDELGDIIAPILSLLDALHDDDPWHGLEAHERQRRVLDALACLMLEEADRRPLVLVFENLQWVDAATRRFLEHLVERIGTARLMLVLDYRPEFAHEWSSRRGFNELRLPPLPREATVELLATMLGEDRGLAPLKELLIQRSQGNPFFLEEIVRALLETKALVHERGRYRLTGDLAKLQVPPTVQAVLAARIDRLSPDIKRLLQSAAAIGMDAPVALLEAVTNAPAETVKSALAHLVTAGFVEETRLFPDLGYGFRSALTRDVAYTSLLRDQRRGLHARIVEAIETAYADRLSSWVEQLAHHALLGEVWPKAALYNMQAGARASAHAANEEAVRAYEAALQALGRLPQTRETIERAVDIRLDLRPPLLQLGRLDEVLAVSREAERIARTLGDERRLARVYSYLVNYHYLKGETTAAIEYGQRCLEVGRAAGDLALQALARQYVGQSHHLRGDYQRAEHALRENLTALDESRSGTAYVASCAWLGWSLADRGEFDTANAFLEHAHRAAETSEHAYSQAIAWAIAGLIAIRSGHPAGAVLPLERSLEMSQRKHLTVWQPIPSSLLGLAFVRMGHVREGLHLLEDSVARSRELGIRAYLASWMLNLAEGYVADGRQAQAAATAREALALAQAGEERGHEAYARHLLGDIVARSTPPDLEEARICYEAALALTESLGLRPLALSVHQALESLYSRRDERASAEHHAALAEKLSSELGLDARPRQSAIGATERDHLFIVARSNPELYQFLSEELATAQRIKVILDRRQGERGRASRAAGEADSRPERRQAQIGEDLRNWGMAVSALRRG